MASHSENTAVVETGFLDCCCDFCQEKVFPCDLDEVLAYKMKKSVYLQNRWLGLSQLLISLAILLYVGVGQIVLGDPPGWMLPEKPIAFTKFDAYRAPGWSYSKDLNGALTYDYCCGTGSTGGNCNPGWTNSPDETPPAGWNNKLGCLGWNENQNAILREASAMTITTRVSLTTYSQVSASCELNINDQCGTNLGARTNVSSHYFVANPEDFTIRMQNAVFSEGIDAVWRSSNGADRFQRAAMGPSWSDVKINFCYADDNDKVTSQSHLGFVEGLWRGSTTVQGKACRHNKVRYERFGDALTLNQLLEFSGLRGDSALKGCTATNVLDCLSPHSPGAGGRPIRFDGIYVIIPVVYAPELAGVGFNYLYKPKYIHAPNWHFEKKMDTWDNNGVETVLSYSGVRIQTLHTGVIGGFNVAMLFTTIAAGMALMGTATVIIEFGIMKMPFPKNWARQTALMERYAYTYSHDFSELLWEESERPDRAVFDEKGVKQYDDKEANDVKHIEVPWIFDDDIDPNTGEKSGKRIEMVDKHFTRGETDGLFLGAGDNVPRWCGVYRRYIPGTDGDNTKAQRRKDAREKRAIRAEHKKAGKSTKNLKLAKESGAVGGGGGNAPYAGDSSMEKGEGVHQL